MLKHKRVKVVAVRIAVISIFFLAPVGCLSQSPLFGRFLLESAISEESYELTLKDDSSFQLKIEHNLGQYSFGDGSYIVKEDSLEFFFNVTNLPTTESYSKIVSKSRMAVGTEVKVTVFDESDKERLHNVPILNLINSEEKELIRLYTDDNGEAKFHIPKNSQVIESIALRFVGYQDLTIPLKSLVGYRTRLEVFMSSQRVIPLFNGEGSFKLKFIVDESSLKLINERGQVFSLKRL